MRFFHYRATDASGRPTEGTIRAVSTDAAAAALREGGFRVTSIGENPPAPVATVARPVERRPAAAPMPVGAAPVIAAPVVSAPVVIKTKFGRDNDLYFLFSQLANLYKAGVNPAQGFDGLANRVSSRYQASLRDVSQHAGETGRVSDVLAKYPYLYPPDVIGALRAGEASGAMEEASQRIASQLFASHRLKRRMTFLFIYFLVLCGVFPVIYGIVQGSLGAISDQNKADGNLPPVATLIKNVKPALVHQIPASVAAVAIGAAILILWHTMPMRMLRHRLVLRFPVLSRRSMSEALSRFTWASGMLSRGGHPPQRVFELAADSVPNLHIREQLRQAASGMRENESLSSIFRRIGFLPPDYANIVENGEISGGVPKALSDVAQAADADFEHRDKAAALWMTVILTILLGVMVFIMLAVLNRMFYSGMIETLTQDPT